jgi:hypothetical protein
MLASQGEEAISHEKYTKRNLVTQHLLRMFAENDDLIKSILPLLGFYDRKSKDKKLPPFSSKAEKDQYIGSLLNQLK